MGLVKAILIYEAAEQPVPLGATADPRVLRALRDRLLEAACEEAQCWRDADPGLYAMKLAEAERLGRVLRILVPDHELRPDLRVVVKPGTSGPPPGGPT